MRELSKKRFPNLSWLTELDYIVFWKNRGPLDFCGKIKGTKEIITSEKISK